MDFRLYIWPSRASKESIPVRGDPYVLEYEGHEVALSRTEGAILSRLISGVADFEELTDSLYGDREDGGPLDPHNVISVTIHRLKKKIKKSPIRIRRRWGRTFYLIKKLQKTADSISDKIVDEGMGSPVAKKGKPDE